MGMGNPVSWGISVVWEGELTPTHKSPSPRPPVPLDAQIQAWLFLLSSPSDCFTCSGS